MIGRLDEHAGRAKFGQPKTALRHGELTIRCDRIFCSEAKEKTLGDMVRC